MRNQVLEAPFIVELSPQLSSRLDELCVQHGISKIDVIRRALALYDVASTAQGNGERLRIFDKDGAVLREVVGLV